MTGVGIKKSAGFTIVELLIVVVVIALLATITVISYNGIKQRANASAILASVDNWEKTIRILGVEGAPIPTGCLGQAGDFPATSEFAEGVCVVQDNNVATVNYVESQYTSWPASIKRPSGALPPSQFSGELSGTPFTLKGRGIWVFSHTPSVRTLTLGWVTQYANQCGRGQAMLPPSGGATFQGYCGLTVTY